MAAVIRLNVRNRCSHNSYTEGCGDCERVLGVVRRVADKLATLQRETLLTRLILIVDFTNPEYDIPKKFLNKEFIKKKGETNEPADSGTEVAEHSEED